MGWSDADLTLLTGAPSAIPAAYGYVFEFRGTQHVVYAAGDGHVYELQWDAAAGWHSCDLTDASGAPALSGTNRADNPVGYAFESQNTQHVIFVGDCGNDTGHIYEPWSDGTGWHSSDLTAVNVPLSVLLAPATGAPLPAPQVSPAGYVFEPANTQHIVYFDEVGHIYELAWDMGSWSCNGPINPDSAPASLDCSAACYVYIRGPTQHVHYIGVDGHIHELWSDGGLDWQHDDLSIQTGSEGAANGVLCAYAFDDQGTRHVVSTGA